MYFYGSILVVIYAATWATFKSKKKKGYPETISNISGNVNFKL